MSVVSASGGQRPDIARSPGVDRGRVDGTLFVNGAIYIDADHRVTNLLVIDGEVAAHDVDPRQYPAAEVVDLAGAAAYPGFNDSHVHLVSMAIAQSLLAPTTGLTNPLDIARAVGARCAAVPKGTPVMGHGFVLSDYNAWTLADLARLDELTGPDCPVMMADQLGHSYIVNSAAMRISRLDGSTPNPPGGWIVKEAGRPTGMLRETAGAIVGNAAIFPLAPGPAAIEPLAQLTRLWARMGYTSAVDLMGGPMGRTMRPELLRQLERQRRLPLRMYYAYTFFGLDDITDGYLSATRDSDLVRFSGLKLFVDGAAGQGGAWTSWENTLPVPDVRHGLHAVNTDDQDGPQYNIIRMIDRTEELGLDVRYHVGGDLAIGAVLAGIETARQKNGRVRGRHTLYHLGFVTADQIARMSRLGDRVIAGVQPTLHWASQSEATKFYYGAHAPGSYPYRAMRDAGLTVSFSTDFASNTIPLSYPTEIMRVALTGGNDPVSHPPLTMRDLIHGFTVGGAATAGDDDAGTLHVGAPADIVVFEKDLYTVPPAQLSALYPRVVGTWVSGRPIPRS